MPYRCRFDGWHRYGIFRSHSQEKYAIPSGSKINYLINETFYLRPLQQPALF